MDDLNRGQSPRRRWKARDRDSPTERAFRSTLGRTCLTRRFVQGFNARGLAGGGRTDARITWLERNRPAGDEDVV
jgi:hypothetical protein